MKTVHISSLLEPVGVRNFNFVHDTGIINKDNFTVSEVGACRAKICKCNDNICQLRLDFETFVLNGPNTGYFKLSRLVVWTSIEIICHFPDTTAATIINANIPVSTATQCIQDQFMVTSPGFNPPPTICGTNTGEHSRSSHSFQNQLIPQSHGTLHSEMVHLINFLNLDLHLGIIISKTKLTLGKPL